MAGLGAALLRTVVSPISEPPSLIVGMATRFSVARLAQLGGRVSPLVPGTASVRVTPEAEDLFFGKAPLHVQSPSVGIGLQIVALLKIGGRRP